MTTPPALLQVDDLDLTISATGARLLAGVSFAVPSGRIVGVVGESGSGKSMMALALLGLLPSAITTSAGRVQLAGRPVIAPGLANPGAATREQAAMIYQNPRASLNPSMRVGAQIRRVLRARTSLGRAAALEESRRLLRVVGITDTARVERSYPHQLSGGMCQRIAIAMALSTSPQLLIADEPTTGLDVTIQAQILLLLRELAAATDCSVLMITHDLGVVSSLCDEIVVLYAGQLMEAGPVADVFTDPRHPYTRFLLDSVEEGDPAADPALKVADRPVDFTIAGCRFSSRCPLATETCRTVRPESRRAGTRTVSCHYADLEVI